MLSVHSRMSTMMSAARRLPLSMTTLSGSLSALSLRSLRSLQPSQRGARPALQLPAKPSLAPASATAEAADPAKKKKKKGVNELFVELHGSEVVEPEEFDHFFEDLKTEVLALSVSKVWDEAHFEWTEVDEYFDEEGKGSKCLCGQKIYRHVVMKNERRSTDTEPVQIVVGYKCAKRFGAVNGTHQLLVRSVLKSLKRVKSKPAKACANLDLINLAAKRHIIPKDGAALYRGIRSNPYVRKRPSPLHRQRMTEMNEAIAFATVHATTCPDARCGRAVFARSDENKNSFWCCDRHKTPVLATPPVTKISNKDAIAAAKRDM